MQTRINKGKVIFFTTMPPSEEDRVQAVLRLASIASSQGYDAIIYLALHSVLLAKKSVFSKLSETTRKMLTDALNAGVKIVACRVAMQGFNVKDEELLEGIVVWEPKDLFEAAKGSVLISM